MPDILAELDPFDAALLFGRCPGAAPFVVRADGTPIFSDAFKSLLADWGLPDNRPFSEILCIEDREVWLSWSSALASEQFEQTTLRFGSEAEPPRAQIWACRSRDGSSTLALAVDDTLRERQTRDLVELALRSELYFRHAGDGVHILDAAGRLVDGSSAFFASLGRAKSEFVGASVEEWFISSGGATPAQLVDKYLRRDRNGIILGEFIRHDGSRFPVEIDAVGFDAPSGRQIFASARDLSERRSAEKRIADSDKLGAALLGSLPSAVALVDAKGFVRRANGSWSADRFAAQIFNPDSPWAPGLLSVASGACASFKTEAFDPDPKTPRWLELSATPLRGAETGAVVSLTDATARKASEKAVKDAADRFEQYFEANLAVKMILDPADGSIVNANRAACLFYGFDKPQLLSKTIYDINALSREQIQDELEEAMSQRRKFFKFKHRLADGSLRDVEVYSGPVEVDGKLLLHSIVHDVSERDAALRELSEKQRLLEAVVSGSSDAVFAKDRQGRYTLMNRSAVEWLSAPQDWAGLRDDDFLPPTLAQALRRREGEALAQGVNLSFEETVPSPSGERTLWITVGPLLLGDGSTFGTFGVARDLTEKNRHLAESGQAQARLLDAASVAKIGYYDYDMSARTWTSSTLFDEIMGIEWTRERRFEDYLSIIHPDDLPGFLKATGEMIAARDPIVQSRYRVVKPGGAFVWIYDRGRVDYDDAGRPLRIRGICQDVSEQRQATESLSLAASVFANAREAIAIVGSDGNFMDVNPAFEQITGYAKSEVVGKNPRLLASGVHDKAFYAHMWESLSEKGHWDGEIWNRRKNGARYPERLSITVVVGQDGLPDKYIALFSDITEIKAHQDQLETLAHFDPLTSLPNRAHMAELMADALERCRGARVSAAVCYLDLDGFKAVNDRHGHSVGDELLVEASRRLKSALRQGDAVARLGGDEFVAIFPDVDNADHAKRLASRMIEALAKPYFVGGEEISVSASAGVALREHFDPSDPDLLLRHADQAMYQAKQAGKNRALVFDPVDQAIDRERRAMASSIQDALVSGQFVLHWQPKVRMTTGEVIGFEGLARWVHPERGILPPASFLPYTSSPDLDEAFGVWVLSAGVRQLAAWRRAGLSLSVSLNATGSHLTSPAFAETLEGILAKNPDAPPSALEIEVLETAALDDSAAASKAFAALRGLGVAVALDDFGTGYSSLSHFRRVPADTVKIDQMFVRDLLSDPDDRAITETIIALANAFGKGLVAEGIETADIGAELVRMGCLVGQGYFIGKPMPSEAVIPWIQNWKPHASWRA